MYNVQGSHSPNKNIPKFHLVVGHPWKQEDYFGVFHRFSTHPWGHPTIPPKAAADKPASPQPCKHIEISMTPRGALDLAP